MNELLHFVSYLEQGFVTFPLVMIRKNTSPELEEMKSSVGSYLSIQQEVKIILLCRLEPLLDFEPHFIVVCSKPDATLIPSP